MSNTDKPEIDFNLDTYRDEVNKTPFHVVHDGKRYRLTHLDECDGWGAVEAFEAGDEAMLRLALGDQFEEFKAAKSLPRGTMQALIRRYLAHCGVDAGN